MNGTLITRKNKTLWILKNYRKTPFFVVIEATGEFDYDLSLKYESLLKECESEDEFLDKSVQLAKKMKKYDKKEFEFLFYRDRPTKRDFHYLLARMIDNINEIKHPF
ncbi:MAG: hypothetical protein GQ574_01605 [Crocinitomix sp.]|nr:hypothetical protein [Crocinitomix sp.]